MRNLLFLLITAVFIVAYIEAEELPEGVTKIEAELFSPFVDVLNLRENPDMNAKVISNIKLGEVVCYEGERSEHTSTVDFNGEKITDTWIKVKTQTGIIGWVWSGFMMPLMKYKNPLVKISTLIPVMNKQISIKITKEEVINKNSKTDFWMSRNYTYYVIKEKIIGETSIKMYFDYGGSDPCFCLGIYIENAYYLSILIDARDLSIFNKLITYFEYIVIDSEQFEREFLNKISNIEKSIILEKFKKNNNNGYVCYDKDIDKQIEIFNKHKYFPQKIHRIAYWRKSPNDFINDVKNSHGGYGAKKWYAACEIIFNSISIGDN